MGKSKGPKYYAVARGTRPGVYYDWPSCEKEVSGFKDAKHKSFPTLAEAQDFVKLHSTGINQWTALNSTLKEPGTATTTLKKRKAADLEVIDLTTPQISARPAKVSKVVETLGNEDGYTIIWTDGSSRGNGQNAASAGLGVYFGANDPRNIAERLAGSRQTNQRAELTAIIRALETVHADEDVIIKSDSQYSINCFTVWHQSWANNGWKNSKKQPVENKDLVQAGLELITSRKGKTKLMKVRAHIGLHGNEMADQLANEGAMKPARGQS
ncbi:protein of unknown function [Taphrina deformans PYCC 5710]|uniref:Ribonuclease H n=1 Tax=Taphrina deformans (strain PYCC 5710 / ATCC 11124 / CBS 356.35 / IMI 108563 / JCM 9778 / NBRC 8474) TaxID=1097556 RepID=R4XGL1_TAPDE|nr:protein of unknown function [Taphrina deformans PYCC 5710]|eukprot:CCG84792.1 protein of unknown function [Taphrina deformans PYCC 5710]